MSIAINSCKWQPVLFIPLVITTAALLALYFPFLQTMAAEWGTNKDYSHGYFIPALVLYMIYSLKDKLVETPVKPSSSGIILVILGLCVLLAAKIGTEYFLQRTSLIIVLLGFVLFLFGRKWTRLLLIPILYLIFMIPLPAIIWNKVAFPLQLFGSSLTEHVVRLLGIPIFREGNVLHLAETTLEVVAACSGLRSLVTMFAMSTLLVWFSSGSPAKKWLLFFSAAPAAIFANIIRLTTTALLASKMGAEVANGFLHDFSGLVTFVIGFCILLIMNKFLANR
ncbi:MAG: exosortase [Desulfobulbaceae bacterium]|nr:MAG: exosortase [Desulfobulbaceae bacterium]